MLSNCFLLEYSSVTSRPFRKLWLTDRQTKTNRPANTQMDMRACHNGSYTDTKRCSSSPNTQLKDRYLRVIMLQVDAKDKITK